LTGSPRAGRAVGARAGAAMKRAVLELGGSDPYVVLGDADVELAATTAVAARTLNSGQTCVAAKRFIVVEPLRAAFEEAVVQKMAALVVGDPLDERTDVGPLARLDLRDALGSQVERSVALGARVLFAAEVPDARAAYFPPLVLTSVTPGMPAFDDELFGPVAAIVTARDDDDALRLANATRYGLGAVVFTRDVARGERIATEGLEAGVTAVNLAVRSHPLVPFGGIRESGHGRELGLAGIRELTNVKAIWLPG
ncbi:MAG: aldehyde dehydrogenase family protein, partial [Deltaproteobacteria bacterium]|nr:aldehyde dehydrogenase family protein [Deltaproteobacteria bacterium]